MSPIATISAEVAAAAKVNEQGENPEAHAALLLSIERLQLAAEKPIRDCEADNISSEETFFVVPPCVPRLLILCVTGSPSQYISRGFGSH